MEAAIVSALTTSTISISSAPPERPATSCSSDFFVPRTVPTTLQPRFRYSCATASQRPRDAPMINAELVMKRHVLGERTSGRSRTQMGRALEAVIPLGQRKAEGGDKSVLIVPITKALAPVLYAVSVDTQQRKATSASS